MKYFLAGIFILNLQACCQNTKNLSPNIKLDPGYDKIERISTEAACHGPQGLYTTRVEAGKDGSMNFSQVFSYRDTPFMAEIKADYSGYQIDQNHVILDTLDEITVEMIRSHNFHWIQINPGSFFKNIRFIKKTEIDGCVFEAKDKLNHPVTLHYDETIDQIRKIRMLNMADTTQIIELIYSSWERTNFGSLAKKIKIIQAQKDTFTFDFISVRVN